MPLASQLNLGDSSWSREQQRVTSGVAMTRRDTRSRRHWFQQQLEPLMDRLYGTALRLTRDPDDAEDIVADAVTTAWSRLEELREPSRFAGWLFHILTNTFISEWRRRQCRPRPAEETDQELADSPDDSRFTLYAQFHQPFLLWWGSVEEHFFNSLLQEDLQQALDDLPDSFRVVMVLVEVQGYTYEEVSHLLGIPLGTVRSRLNRARGRLQKALWEQARDAGIHRDRQTRDQGKGERRP
jgi:RNA polymerase sigma-70 factor (ECF subfamily)